MIGSRRVSYILYMPLPNYQLWQPEWGGALELYPVKENANGQLEPEPVPSKTIPPSWDQFIFFEVQPGRSFHSVEEVVVGGEGEDGRDRLSISGWFHAAQEGEEGYIPEPPTEVKSSREQLVRRWIPSLAQHLPSGRYVTDPPFSWARLLVAVLPPSSMLTSMRINMNADPPVHRRLRTTLSSSRTQRRLRRRCPTRS